MVQRATHALLALVIAVAAPLVSCQAQAGERGGGPAELAALIDQHIQSRLNSEGLQPASLADDAEFLRRVYLDLHGVVPRHDDAKRFLADSDPSKRARVVDGLLASPRYGEYLAGVWQAYLMS